MQVKTHRTSKSRKQFTLSLLTLAFLSASGLSFANTINITTDQVINTPTTYKNVTLNMSAGFIIAPGGSLDIENSTVNVQSSPTNPFFVHLTTGALTLKDNTVNVSVSNITPNSNAQALYQLIKVDQGGLIITHNYFAVDKAYSFGFLTTNKNYATSGFNINENLIKNFHGGVYLFNSYANTIDDNSFYNISQASILNSGDSSEFKRNIFLFPGNLRAGNAFELINSAHLKIAENIIASSSNYGIHIVGGKNIIINDNKITDSRSYAIEIDPPTAAIIKKNPYLAQLGFDFSNKKSALTYTNKRITITNNYIGQNRYGITASQVNSLNVANNTFIQKFNDDVARKFWTNNDHLMTDVTNLKWEQNLYKEAFTQEVPGDNAPAKKFIVFPKSGGVSL